MTVAEPASIAALISAAAVVGALATSSIVTWYVDSSTLLGDVEARSQQERKDDAVTREFVARLKPLETRQRALLWVAIIQWVVVASLLATSLWLACEAGRVPFVLAASALMVALVLLPVGLTGTAMWRLRKARAQLGLASRKEAR